VVYLVRDGHGSTRALTDVAGRVIATYDYAAYGEAIGFDPAAAITRSSATPRGPSLLDNRSRPDGTFRLHIRRSAISPGMDRARTP
jgi:hypothetical protein